MLEKLRTAKIILQSFVINISLFFSYEERKRSLDTIASRHKDSNTFEDFTSRVYSPLTLSHNIPANPNSSLASAMIDNNYRNQSKSSYSFELKFNGFNSISF